MVHEINPEIPEGWKWNAPGKIEIASFYLDTSVCFKPYGQFFGNMAYDVNYTTNFDTRDAVLSIITMFSSLKSNFSIKY